MHKFFVVKRLTISKHSSSILKGRTPCGRGYQELLVHNATWEVCTFRCLCRSIYINCNLLSFAPCIVWTWRVYSKLQFHLQKRNWPLYKDVNTDSNYNKNSYIWNKFILFLSTNVLTCLTRFLNTKHPPFVVLV